MKTIGKIAIGSAVAIFCVCFHPRRQDRQTVGDQPSYRTAHYCASYTQAGIDCSFTSYAQCEAMVSGQSADAMAIPLLTIKILGALVVLSKNDPFD